jgi:VanZ family protein
MAAHLNIRRAWVILGWLLVLVVIYLSLTPKPPPTMMTFGDKISHFAAYATLMSWWHQIDRNAYRLALIFVLMGLALEILQSLSGFRQGDIFDMAANTVGVGIGWFTARFVPAWCSRKLTA